MNSAWSRTLKPLFKKMGDRIQERIQEIEGFSSHRHRQKLTNCTNFQLGDKIMNTELFAQLIPIPENIRQGAAELKTINPATESRALAVWIRGISNALTITQITNLVASGIPFYKL